MLEDFFHARNVSLATRSDDIEELVQGADCIVVEVKALTPLDEKLLVADVQAVVLTVRVVELVENVNELRAAAVYFVRVDFTIAVRTLQLVDDFFAQADVGLSLHRHVYAFGVRVDCRVVVDKDFGSFAV